MDRSQLSSRYPRKDSSPKKPTDIPDPIIANETVPANSKLSEEKTVDSFLNEVNQKRVSDEIRQRKREEKPAKVETVSPEKDKQVSVDKRMLCKENQKKQRENFIHEVFKGVVTKVAPDDLKTIRSCDPLTVEMGTPTFSLLYEKLCDAVILADHATQEAIFCYCQFGKALIQRRGEIASEKQVDPESNTTQLCEPSSQSDKKNSDLSHITSSNAPTESQIPIESATKKLDTKVEVVLPIPLSHASNYSAE
ncbi:20907_t:CDS:2, partial [Dentiscutata erythropus]